MYLCVRVDVKKAVVFEWYECICSVFEGTDALVSFHRQSTTVSAWVPPQFVQEDAFLVDLLKGSFLRHPYCKMLLLFINLVVPASRQTHVLAIVLLYIAPPKDIAWY